MIDFSRYMKYLVIEGRFHFDKESADVLYTTGDKAEAIQAAKDFGQGMVVVAVDMETNHRKRIYTASYEDVLGLIA